MADNAVKRDKNVIQDAKGFFEWASRSNSSIQYEWVGSEEISNCEEEIQQMDLIPVKGTMKIHAVFGLSETSATRMKSCFCDKCFVNGVFSLEGCCDGWERHIIKRLENDHDVVTESTEAAIEEDKNYQVNDWVAALYQGTWYIGEIVEYDPEEDDFHVNFLKKSKLIENFTFKKAPEKNPDIIWVYRENILCKITEPVAVGKSGRSFSISRDIVEKIEGHMKK